MSYIALYRKFRPSEFDQVKGQEHIVTTLKNQIINNRLGHAYLFCGTRGTGKTSVAKIFAKAVNCENNINGNPCNECPSCKAIQNNSSMNVIEIDAASNNGVDNIRQIKDEVQYSPAEGKYKVYIIDEVHMLSIGAFNALLKTLEEPPSYVIFILATTEVHKIPITILSRCQRYDFKRISVDIITESLRSFVKQENAEADEKALRYIAKMADGSMRDALSLLDQCVAYHMNETLTYDHVLAVLGAVDTEVYSLLLKHILNKDTIFCIKKLDELVMQGIDLSQFIVDFTWYLRNLLLIKATDSIDEELFNMSADRLVSLKEESELISSENLMRYIRIFSELSNQIKYASQKKILIELALIKLMVPQMEDNLDSLSERINVLEKKVEEGITVHTVMTEKKNGQAKEEKPKPQLPKAGIEDVIETVNNWNIIERQLSGPLRVYLKMAKISAKEENILLLVFTDEIGFDRTTKSIVELEEVIEEKVGKAVKIETKLLASEEKFEDYYVEIREKVHMPIIEEEDN